MGFFSICDPAAGSRPAMILAVVSALLVVALNASAQIDLTGRWRVREGTPDIFADIVQSGTSVTATWMNPGPPPPFDLINVAGTFDQTTLIASGGAGAWSVTMLAYGSGDVLYGTIVTAFDPNFNNGPIHFTRCECYDGNEIDGDGCSSVCRVEPCFSCTPEPSVCTPSPDTATCDDGNDCTTGETCSAGICGASSAVSQCVNLDGLWTVTTQDPFSETEDVSNYRYLQREGVVTVVGSSQGVGDFPSSLGTIDTETGEMSLISAGGQANCMVSSDFSGTASLDNLTFSGSGAAYALGLGGNCVGITRNQQGVRFPSVSVPSLSGWGLIAVTLVLVLLALGLLWRAGKTA